MRRPIFLAGLAGLMLLACGAARAQDGGYPSAAVYQVVRPMLLSNVGLMQVPDLQLHLAQIAGRLAARLPAPQPAPVIYLVPLRDFVCESGPGGGIFLSLGTLKDLHSDDAVAYVIAHEMGHIWLGHLKSRGTTQSWSQTLRVMAIGGMRIAAHSDLTPTSLSQLAQPDIAEVAATEAAGDVANAVMFPFWSRDQEHEADRFAVSLVIKAGYSADGSDAVFNQLEADDALRAKQLADIQAAQAQAPAASLDQAVNGLVHNAIGDLQQGLSHLATTVENNHGLASQRHDAVRAYIDQIVTTSAGSLQTRSWLQAMADPDTQARLQAYEIFDQANTAFYQGALSQSVSLMRILDHSLIATDPLVVNLRVHLVRDGGGNVLAQQMLVQLMRQPYVVADSYIQLMQLDMQMGLFPQAVATMNFANGVLQSPQELYPVDLQVLRATRQQLRLEMMLGRCYLVGDQTLSAQCKAASGT